VRGAQRTAAVADIFTPRGRLVMRFGVCLGDTGPKVEEAPAAGSCAKDTRCNTSAHR
jgi:hypothetical protein